MKMKRLFSYIIDMLIVLLLVVLVRQIVGTNEYTMKITTINEQYIEKEIDFKTYLSNYSLITQNMDKDDLGINIYMTFLMIIFFIIIPNITNGQTIGQKIFKIKMIGQNDKITIEELAGRAVVINGIGYMLFMFGILFLTNHKIYFILINLFAFFQLTVVIINVFMLLYKKGNCSLTDKFTKTRIEEI